MSPMEVEALEKLKQELEGHSHDFPEDLLLRVLIAKEFNVEKSRLVVQKYVNLRKDFPNLFPEPTSHSRDVLRRIGTLVDKQVITNDGHLIFFTTATEWDPDHYSLDELCAALLATSESLSMDSSVHVPGFIHLVDASGITWKYVKAIKPSLVMNVANMFVYSLPTHLKNIVIFNHNWLVDVIWKILKPLIPAELAKLVVILDKTSKLKKFLPENVLTEKTFIPTEASIQAHLDFVEGGKENLAKHWNMVFNE